MKNLCSYAVIISSMSETHTPEANHNGVKFHSAMTEVVFLWSSVSFVACSAPSGQQLLSQRGACCGRDICHNMAALHGLVIDWAYWLISLWSRGERWADRPSHWGPPLARCANSEPLGGPSGLLGAAAKRERLCVNMSTFIWQAAQILELLQVQFTVQWSSACLCLMIGLVVNEESRSRFQTVKTIVPGRREWKCSSNDKWKTQTNRLSTNT